MISFNENERFDFMELEDFLKKNFKNDILV